MGNRASAKAKNYQQGKRERFPAPRAMVTSLVVDRSRRQVADHQVDVVDIVRSKVHQNYVDTKYTEALEASKKEDK